MRETQSLLLLWFRVRVSDADKNIQKYCPIIKWNAALARLAEKLEQFIGETDARTAITSNAVLLDRGIAIEIWQRLIARLGLILKPLVMSLN
jgi:hypothetical protein